MDSSLISTGAMSFLSLIPECESTRKVTDEENCTEVHVAK